MRGAGAGSDRGGATRFLAALREALAALPATPRYWVALSGGPDSGALVHGLAALREAVAPAQIGAVHVNHGLSAQADAWQAHCAALCARLGVAFRAGAVDARPAPGESPEAAARNARYGALAAVLDAGEILLTGHHQEDQAETVLLQLLRGGGPAGLAAMPGCAPFGRGWLARPLLSVPRALVRAYAAAEVGGSVDDPANRDRRVDRSLLRESVMPALRARWPGAAATLARAAAQQAEAAALLDALAALDLETVRADAPGALSCRALAHLDPARQRNVLRAWLRRRGLPPPGRSRLESLRVQALCAAADRAPRVHWPGGEVRRYRDALLAQTPPPDSDPGAGLPRSWNLRSPCELAHGRLLARRARGAGLAVPGDRVEVRLRRGGESLRPVGSAHVRSLKGLFQARGVTPWARERVPLLYAGGALAAVAGLWVAAPFAAAAASEGWVVRWEDRWEGGAIDVGADEEERCGA